jgi:hypothetical protein
MLADNKGSLKEALSKIYEFISYLHRLEKQVQTETFKGTESNKKKR